MNQLVVIEEKDLVTFDREVVDDFLKKLRERETSVVGDISTETGRKDIASRAYRLARVKTEIDKKGALVKDEAQKIVKSVDAERRRIWDEMEAIQHDVRAPLTAWEEADKNRVADHEAKILEIEALTEYASNDIAPDEIDLRLEALGGIAQRDWQEFGNRATMAINMTRDHLTTVKARRVKEIADAAELVRLQKIEADRLQKEREEKIASDAKAEGEAAAKKAEEAQANAEWLAMYAEAEGHNKWLDSEAEKVAAAAKAEQDKVIAAKKAEEEKITAANSATQAERDRQAGEAKRLADETTRREADKVHRSKINNEARDALQKVIDEMPKGDDDDPCKEIIKAIAQGKIPHVKISY